jgi:carbon-monoxide dehydrogenase small subunit
MVNITLTLNGKKIQAEVEPRLSLADFLREQQRQHSVHLGCEHGVCGACTIVMNGQIARSCIALAAALDGADIWTLEGLDADPTIAVLRDTFHEQHGLQCGFCTPAMLITAREIVSSKAELTEAGVREALAGNICRCTGYAGIVRAVLSAGERLRQPGAAAAAGATTGTQSRGSH